MPVTEKDRLNEIVDYINNAQELDASRFPSPAAISKGMILCAPLNERYHRAKVLKVISGGSLQFKVRLLNLIYHLNNRLS